MNPVDIIHTGLQRDRKDSLAASPASSRLSASSSLPPTPNLAGKRKLDINTDVQHRSPSANISCQSRDNSQCIISKDRQTDVAHIYPFTLRDRHQYEGPRGNSIWGSLGVFWSKERVESWYNAIFPEGKYAEACYNRLCLSPSAHRYFGKGYFALKPISIYDDQKYMVVKFFWLHKGPSDNAFVNFRDTPLLEGQDEGDGYSRLFNHETTSIIRSGDELRLKTENPQTHPLPRWDILEMQWFMNRVVAISGAADVEDDYSDGDDDDDEYELASSYYEQDFDLLDKWDSLGERQSEATEALPPSSPPSSPTRSSSGFPNGVVPSHKITARSAVTGGWEHTDSSHSLEELGATGRHPQEHGNQK